MEPARAGVDIFFARCVDRVWRHNAVAIYKPINGALFYFLVVIQPVMESYILIAAAALNNGIGLNNSLPWRLPKDQAFFKRVTSQGQELRNVAIMGRLTWESLPPRMKPLPERFNIVVSRNKDYFR